MTASMIAEVTEMTILRQRARMLDKYMGPTFVIFDPQMSYVQLQQDLFNDTLYLYLGSGML